MNPLDKVQKDPRKHLGARCRVKGVKCTMTAAATAKSALTVEHVRGRSVLVGSHVEAPLQVLNPTADGAAAWVSLATLGGGLVGADAVELGLIVREGATLFVSSQATTKVYRGTHCQFLLDATVADGGVLVVWPEPVTCFAGARLVQRQRVQLSAGATLVFVDSFTAGRVSRGERWAFEHLEARLDVDVAGVPWLREGLLLSAAHGALVDRQGSMDAFANVVLWGQGAGEIMARARAAIEQPRWSGAQLTMSDRAPGALLRVAATTTQGLSRVLHDLLNTDVALLIGDRPLTACGVRAPHVGMARP